MGGNQQRQRINHDQTGHTIPIFAICASGTLVLPRVRTRTTAVGAAGRTQTLHTRAPTTLRVQEPVEPAFLAVPQVLQTTAQFGHVVHVAKVDALQNVFF